MKIVKKRILRRQMTFLALYLLLLMIFHLSAKNFIHCKRNSTHIENKSDAAAKINRWLEGSFLCHKISIFFLSLFSLTRKDYHLWKKNIIHKRRKSSHRDKNSAAADKENHFLQKIIPLSKDSL
jgi:hypothetical protein